MRNKKSAPYAIAAFLIAVIIVGCSMRVWEMAFNVPASLDGDWVLGMRVLKSMEENGIMGHFISQRMGAPGVAHIIDTPYQDFLTSFLLLATDFFVKNGFIAFHVVYFLNFGLAASFMYIALNKLKVDRIIATIFGVIFSLTPYHFLRGYSHFELANIAVIPIGLWLSLAIINDDFTLVKEKKGKKGKSRLNWKQIFIYLIATGYLGISYGYYPAFMIIIMSIALLFKMIKLKSWKPLLSEATLIYFTGMWFLLSVVPNIIFNSIYGATTLTNRTPTDSEFYALRLIQFILPNVNTRFSFLKPLTDKYNSLSLMLNENSYAAGGVVAVICLCALLVWFIYSFVSKQKHEISDHMDFISLAAVCFFVVCTFGGIGAIFAYFISPQIRCWNRGSVVIVCLCLAAGAVLLSHFLENKNKVWIYLFSVIILGIAVYDQVPSYSAGWQNDLKETSKTYQDYFAELEKEESNTMVYQLPFIKSYEVPPKYKEGQYAGSLPYIYTNTIRWSYGGTPGRDDMAESLYLDNGITAEFLKGIKEKGFSGVLIDRSAFADNGAVMIDFYSDELALTPIVSNDGRFYYYNIADIDVTSVTDTVFYKSSADRIIDVLSLNKSCEKNIINYLQTSDAEILAEVILNNIDGFKNMYIYDDAQFIDLCYDKILDRKESLTEKEDWMKTINNGMSRKEVVVKFVESKEFIERYK